MKTSVLKGLVSIFLLMASHGFAATLVTTVDSNVPSANVTLSFSTLNYTSNSGNTTAFGWNGYTGSRRDIGQTFSLSSAITLDKITLQIAGVSAGAPGAAFTLYLYQFNTTSDLTAASTVGSWSGTLPDSSSLTVATYTYNNGTVGPYLTFDIPDVALSSGCYGFVLSFTSLASNEQLSFWTKGGGAYSGGQEIQTDTVGATTFTNSNGNDMLFYIQSVPEPGSRNLSAGAIFMSLFFLLWRRRMQPKTC